MTTFRWAGVDLPLFDHPYNVTARNERAIEIAVARVFLAAHVGRGLEIGNVLGHYGHRGHDVVDLYEVSPGVRNIDVFDVEGRWDWLVSISTVEHVGWPHDSMAALSALDHMRSLVHRSGSMLVTVGLGQHTALDDAIYRDAFGPTWEWFYVRDRDHWREIDRSDGPWRPYDWYTPTARTVWLATWEPS